MGHVSLLCVPAGPRGLVTGSYPDVEPFELRCDGVGCLVSVKRGPESGFALLGFRLLSRRLDSKLSPGNLLTRRKSFGCNRAGNGPQEAIFRGQLSIIARAVGAAG